MEAYEVYRFPLKKSATDIHLFLMGEKIGNIIMIIKKFVNVNLEVSNFLNFDVK